MSDEETIIQEFHNLIHTISGDISVKRLELNKLNAEIYSMEAIKYSMQLIFDLNKQSIVKGGT